MEKYISNSMREQPKSFRYLVFKTTTHGDAVHVASKKLVIAGIFWIFIGSNIDILE